MRTTLTLDDDVAARLEHLKREREITFRQAVNDALRRGLDNMDIAEPPGEPFRTRPVDLGKCLFANLDNTWEVLGEAEGPERG